jgi:phosphoribosylformylglycinamidine cyclo-ligase
MPDIYPPGEFDMAGFVVSLVEREAIIDGSRIGDGDLLFGLPSNGLHTNGYSLVRPALGIGVDAARAAEDRTRLERFEPELGESLADALLKPHRSYVQELKPALGLIKGMAHITGGGFEENLPRMLPEGFGARLSRGSWPVPPIFPFIQRAGRIEDEEMHRVFNMGIGVVAAVGPEDALRFRSLVPEAIEIGRVIAISQSDPKAGWL